MRTVVIFQKTDLLHIRVGAIMARHCSYLLAGPNAKNSVYMKQVYLREKLSVRLATTMVDAF